MAELCRTIRIGPKMVSANQAMGNLKREDVCMKINAGQLLLLHDFLHLGAMASRA